MADKLLALSLLSELICIIFGLEHLRAGQAAKPGGWLMLVTLNPLHVQNYIHLSNAKALFVLECQPQR